MQSITKKSEVLAIALRAAQVFAETGRPASVAYLHEQLLRKKVKFPLLEAAGRVLVAEIPADEIVAYAEAVARLRAIGSNVIAGIILQERLPGRWEDCIQNAQEFIRIGGEWYSCDIIAERVMGHALLTAPEITLPILEKIAENPDPWMVRTVGVGGHYAVKKGLDRASVVRLFELLFSLSEAKAEPVRTGIGWAAKTVAKFHPGVIEQFAPLIRNKPETGTWFLRKIDIGLKINAKRNLR